MAEREEVHRFPRPVAFLDGTTSPGDAQEEEGAVRSCAAFHEN